MKIVEITWLDSVSVSPWKDLEEAQGLKPVSVTSVGYLVETNGNYVTIAGMIGLDDCVSMIQVIPQGCILIIEEI